MAEEKVSVVDAVTGIILAGGKSIRYGRDKAFERIAGETLIDRALRQVGSLSGVQELMLVTSEKLAAGLNYLKSAVQRGQGEISQCAPAIRIVCDQRPEQGPMGGIHAGLSAATCEYSVIVGCDMPFLNRGLLQYMFSLRSGYDMVVPRVSGLPEPLHAIYSKSCLPAIETRLEAGKPMVYRLLEGVRVRFVEQDEVERFDPKHLSFFNINSMDDMEKARELLEKCQGQPGNPENV